jgi:uncharacterized protein YegJ (DUF2314 family)
MFDGSASAMAGANQATEDSLKYFWRELAAWEARRIVPGLEMVAIKVAFTDGDTEREGPSHEHMWVTNIDFNGISIRGTLINSPNWLRKVTEGGRIETTLAEFGEWK